MATSITTDTRYNSQESGRRLWAALGLVTLSCIGLIVVIYEFGPVGIYRYLAIAMVGVVALLVSSLVLRRQLTLAAESHDAAHAIESTDEGGVFSREVKEHLKFLEDLHSFFGNSIRPAEIFRVAADRIEKIVPYHSCALYVADTNGTKLKSNYQAGDYGADLSGHLISLNEGIAGLVFVNRSPMVDEAMMIERRALPARLVGKFGSAAGSPLLRDGDPFAVFVAYSKPGEIYTNETARLLSAVCERLSPLLQSSLTFESTADESLTDGITGLPNERAFFAVLENQIAESLRYREQRPLTIISMDIQEFGEINSRFGHVTGDDVLAFTAKTVKDQLRQMDYLARISGDEFAAILPTASEKTAKIIIDRISKSLASVGFATPSGEQLTLTLNIGSATVLVDAENAPDLFTAARTERNRNKNQRPGAVLYFPTESVS